MGTVHYMLTSEPSYQLLALAVFADSLKTAYVRSIHVHAEKVGAIYELQQEFLLKPGEYVRQGEPVISQSFQGFGSDSGTKQAMEAVMKKHRNEGWHCVLNYRSDSPSETFMPYLLTPSRNAYLRQVPWLERDLKLVECALMSSMRTDKCVRISSALTLSFPSNLTPLDHFNSSSPGLETPKRTSLGLQSDSKQKWGSELELASPEIAHINRSSQSDQGFVGSIWNPPPLLDLNLDLIDSAAQDTEIDCTLGLSSPVLKPKSYLDLQLGMPSPLSFQQSAVTEEDSMDCITLESHGDSLSSYRNMVKDLGTVEPTIEAMETRGEKPVCSEDSIGFHGCVINMSRPLDMNGWASCSSISMESVGQGPRRARGGGSKSKRRGGVSGLRPTSERLHEITAQEITKYFSVPITQAAKELKVGLTVLKKRCRHLGIPRWPHRKMKSIDSLINNVQDLAEDQGVERSPRVRNTVKELEEQRKLMEEMPGVELAERTKKLRQACFKANYKRRKMSVSVGSSVPFDPLIPFPPSIPHSFNLLSPSTLIIPTPLNHHTMDHFL